MQFEWSITFGNILTMIGFGTAIVIALNRHLTALQIIQESSKRQEDSVKELHSIAVEQMKLNASTDKRLAILEDRGGRSK